MSSSAIDTARPSRRSRVVLGFALAAMLGTLIVPGGVAGKATTVCCYHYVGTITQNHHSHFFDLNLTRNSSGSGWQVLARWRPTFSPKKCSTAFLSTPQTTLTANNVHIKSVVPKVKSKLVVKNGKGETNHFIHSHKVKNFTAVFTKGKVTGSFTNDTFVFQGVKCTTGPITFSAVHVAF